MAMNNGEGDRRRFSRIPFDAIAHVKTQRDDLYLNCHVIDVSLQGLLINKPGQWHAQLEEECRVDLVLEQGEIVIEIQATVAHITDDMLGFACGQIDVDSITHLKRLIALNLGDDALLNREMSALFKPL